ncbi:MAG: DUF4295 family protein [Bacteroidales bacterium]
MAKKSVAAFSSTRGANRTKVKCIRMVRSDKNSPYTFLEEMVSVDEVDSFFKKS